MPRLVSDIIVGDKEVYYGLKQGTNYKIHQAFWKIEKYAKFLKQLLQLWMFIPSDLKGNVLEEPKGIKCCGVYQMIVIVERVRNMI